MQAIYDATDVTVLLSKTVDRTPEQRRALLIKANILDKNGDYLPDFFRADTVKKNKEHRRLLTLAR